MRATTFLIVAAATVFVTGLAQAQTAPTPRASAMKAYCARTTPPTGEGRLTSMVAAALKLSDSQKVAFDAWRDARHQAQEKMRADVCSQTADPATLEGRLAMRATFLKARLAAMDTEDPKLLDFYRLLDEKQRATVDGVRREWRAKRAANSH